MSGLIPDKVKKISEYVPNTTVYRIRMDANENPYSASGELREEFAKRLSNMEYNRYPDPSAKELIYKFCEVYDCDPDNTVAGNGSDELISILFSALTQPGDNVAVVMPDFSMYGFYAELSGCNVKSYIKNNVSEINFNELAEFVSDNDCRAVILSNPCNPTGRAYSEETILSFVKKCGCAVVIDEAYMEFCREGCSVLKFSGQIENLVVLKTLSKVFGMAALRCGFAVTSNEIASALRKIKSPYNISMTSQVMACTALEHAKQIFSVASELRTATSKLYESLCGLSDKGGYITHPTDANFVLLEFRDGGRAERLFTALRERGISIRYMNKNYLRISCGTDAENKEFLKEFEELL